MAAACAASAGAERPAQSGAPTCEPREIVRPPVSVLCRERRSNIPCPVQRCGRVLPNPPALNMHLVKSHGLREGLINPTVRKVLKSSSQILYCCPIEGCPRGPNRPFSKFSLVKQHFMKMHAEKKHKCEKCGNSYSTEWDLKRHAGCCGKTFQCTCGCPYASRTALLSHIYRTGHEVPAEHRDPPVKKRKMEGLIQNQKPADKPTDMFSHELSHTVSQKFESSEIKPLVPLAGSSGAYIIEQSLGQPKHTQQFLLPKPGVGLVQFPVMQFPHVSAISAADYFVKPAVVAADDKGSVARPVHLVPHSMIKSSPNGNTFMFKGTLPFSKVVNSNSEEPVCSRVQVSLDNALPDMGQGIGNMCSRNRITSVNAQTDLSCISQLFVPAGPWNFSESSCSQTDLTFSAQVLLPVSVEIQTLGPDSKGTSTMATQTDPLANISLSSCGVSRETQTNGVVMSSDNREQMDQAVMCCDIFNIVNSSYTVSTQTHHSEDTLIAGSVDQSFLESDIGVGSPGTTKSESRLSDKTLIAANVNQNFLETNVRDLSPCTVKSVPYIGFSAQSEILPQQNMTDNQTQTMDLLSDLENILSGNLSNHTLDNRSILSEANAGGEMHLSSGSAQHAGIDFDIEEFFSASNIQTQTDESELGNINAESLDIETQTDFFFLDGSTLRGNASFLAMFDTQTQTDLNFFLDHSTHLPLGNLLKQASFSVSTDSSDNETQTDTSSAEKNILSHNLENQVQLSSAETQTIDSCLDTLGNLFLTTNETQTAMDDFLLADLAWNTMESQFSSVETQTCKELLSFFQTSDNLAD